MNLQLWGEFGLHLYLLEWRSFSLFDSWVSVTGSEKEIFIGIKKEGMYTAF